jgi:hypothetical protein
MRGKGAKGGHCAQLPSEEGAGEEKVVKGGGLHSAFILVGGGRRGSRRGQALA